MATQLPSSFASAAAGQTTRGDARSGARGDSVRGAGSGEWARLNGTRTFRRSSTTPFNIQSVAASNSTDATQNPALDSNNNSINSSSASQPAPTAPDQQQQQHPQQNNQHNQGPLRYSKDELYEIYKHSAEAANNIDMSSLFAPSWNPNQTNGTASRVWGKTSDSPHVPQDPTVCWDPNGTVKPIGLEPMTAEEREMFATDVNSTLKPPQSQQNKDGGVQGSGIQNGGRKTSVSVSTSNNFSSTASPATASRPATRRRETVDTNPFPPSAVASPTTAGRFPRDDPWLPRRNTDLRESITDEPAAEETTSRTQPFGLTRSNTAGSSAFGSSASLWGPAATTPGAGIGAFGSFALNTATSTTIGEKRFGGAGGSRLAHLIPKDSNENVAAIKGNESAPGTDTNRGWRPRQRTDTDPFGPDDSLTGSAILGGAQDNNSPPASSLQRSGVFDTPVKGSSGDFGMSALNLGGNNNQNEQGNGPASPSETNPYRSPLAERGDEGHDDAEIDRLTHNAAGSEPQSNFSTLSRAFGGAPFDGSDRSQTSSVGAKGFPTVNTLGGWPTAPSVGTPDRERQPFNSAFGTSIFSPIGDLQSPGFGGLGGFGVAGGSGLGRANKLSSLFPPAMQAQMHVGHEQENLSDSVPDLRQANPLGAIGRGAIGTQPRDAASPMRAGRGAFEDLFPGTDAIKSAFTSGEHQAAGLTSTAAPSSGFPATTAGPAFSATPTAGEPNQQQQQRTMVMPDRMRWVYLDPQGQMQGPFSGLEMNDWYKANFFSPDLRVKRVEDPDFEPLGQLIRRIGNSREPFLVPQMGIPHGPPPSAGPFALGAAEAIPPLQGAFPSFGRTLTAAQQNDLERRKQEEQLYHARQREFLHHHQSFGRLPLQPGIPGALHHHSSAHSLQSQPSFGSITSPIGMPQPPLGAIGPNSGFFEAPVSLGQAPAQPGLGPDLFAADLNLGERQLLANLQANGGLPGSFPTQPIGAPIGDNSSLRGNLPSVDQLRNDEQGFNAKLKEFHELRAQHDAEEAAAAAAQEVLQQVTEEAPKPQEEPEAAPAPVQETAQSSKKQTQEAKEAAGAKEGASQTEVSLTEKIKKTQAENNAAKLAQQAAASGLPMPFPPPSQANTPLAAPTAQRPASGLPARYGERSGSGTPDTTSDASVLAPPPTAPWAGTETQKGPSLREIQEAEAKKAAKKEEAAAAARRAALEQEAAALREREKAAAAAHIGLPATSTWGTGSPVGAPASGSPWKQPAAKVAVTTTGSKKTLAEIQREEELRKQKAKEAAMQASVMSGSALGKRYADLASKTWSTSAPPGMITPGAAAQAAAAAAAAASSSVGGGWSTVGAGGKVKIPTGPAAATSRPVSTAPVKTSVVPAAKVAAKPATAALKDAKNVAMEEFKKWLHRELSRGLSGVNDIETFASTLLELPLDVAILSECVYGFSTTMDGRHFAEEFVRRRKLADKGIVEKDSNTGGAMSSSNGGWSEVAKKGGNGAQAAAVKEDPMAAVAGFRVVQAKKGKGKK
ncbi:hypothetical protein QBC45DRAFT_427525 [Copromyces sp. CBS 386.78]|nr:hypothetical protein QBC45DRAFT_427525 [Copromyces sp. CBS 386.78]